MNLKTVRLEFDPSQIQKIFSIAMDDDRDAALEFIRQNLAKRLEKALSPH